MLQRLGFVLLVICVGRATTVLAQADPVRSANAEAAIGYTLRQANGRSFTTEDVQGLLVLSEHHDALANVDYVYLGQAIDGVPIRGSVASVAVRDDRVRSFEHTFLDRLASRTSLSARSPTLSDAEAISVALRSLGVVSAGGLGARSEQPARARDPLSVEDYYLRLPDGSLRLCKGVDVAPEGSDANLRLSIDARTGEVLQQEDRTVYCSFGHPEPFGHDCEAAVFPRPARHAEQYTPLANGSYLVFPWPAESPDFGPQETVTDPADPEFSPFGWHDTDGAVGPEYTITRGNNAHAYADLKDEDESLGNEPDGGAELTFRFPYVAGASAEQQSEAAVVNLFYVVNRMHDFAARYGFTEAAGNFQQQNYGGRGKGNDPVVAQAQDGAQTADDSRPDADHINNANFVTPVEGKAPRMQMYLWDRLADLEFVSAPGSSSSYGPSSRVGGDWGEGAFLASGDSVRSAIVQVRDAGGESATDGCEALTNATALEGKIAVVDRGTCQFGYKALQAQRAGAVGVIICNSEDALVALGAGTDGKEVTVPVVMLTESGCARLRVDVDRNPSQTFKLSYPEGEVNPYLSSSFDNGIVAHEYAHGISTRLTGGAATDDCLSRRGNVEQMGEGWSDFFALVTTLQPGQDGSTPRGLGNFASGAPTDGPGMRNYRYSTNLEANPVNYADVADESFSRPHGIGSIWASMLWDLYWDLVERYGRAGDLVRGEGGDTRAIALVMQGLKLQPCNPGFVEGRDAILAADSLLYGGEDDALIWGTFARRGLGYGADGGATDNRYDGTASFELPPKHANRVYLSKSTAANVDPGGSVATQLRVTNWRTGSLRGARLTDELPRGASLMGVTHSDTLTDQPVDYTLVGDLLTVELPELAREGEYSIRYTYTAPLTEPSPLYVNNLGDVSAGEDFAHDNLVDGAPDAWEVTVDDGFGDDVSYLATWGREASQPSLALSPSTPIRVSGNHPLLSFHQKFQLETEDEGGFLEIESDDNAGYTPIEAGKILRGGYSGLLAGRALGLRGPGSQPQGWRGDQPDWRHVLVDLSEYTGKDVRIRWRAARSRFLDGDQPQPVGEGWRIDEIAVLDGVLYNGEARVVLDAEQLARATAPGAGTFVDYNRVTTSIQEVDIPTYLSAYPNPSAGEVTLEFAPGAGALELVGANGRVLSSHPLDATRARHKLDLGSYPAGVYFARLRQAGSTAQLRLVRR